MFRDTHTVLCACFGGTYCYYDIKTEQYKKISNNLKARLDDILLIDDKTFLTCSKDYTIKVMKIHTNY